MLLLFIIIVFTIYHFGLNLILGILKESVFLFVKNKRQHKFYIYYDYIVPMIIAIIPVIILIIFGIILGVPIILGSGILSLFNIETVIFILAILVEMKLFFDAYKEYNSVKDSHQKI